MTALIWFYDSVNIRTMLHVTAGRMDYFSTYSAILYKYWPLFLFRLAFSSAA